MTTKDERVREFLATRRAKLTPEDAGIPRGTGVRRVPGLRREEVAMLAGVSVDYYARIEKGDLHGVSDEVLDALARALQLSEDEAAYLYDLARSARRPARAPRQRRTQIGITPRLQHLVDAMPASPVLAIDQRLDILGANPLGRALFDLVLDSPVRRSTSTAPNLALFVFLDPAAGELYADLDEAAASCVRILRAAAGAAPHDRHLAGLIGELATRSEGFSRRWAAHDVGVHRAGSKLLHHRAVGELDLGYEELRVESVPGVTLSAYVAEPASTAAERLQLLAAWAATERSAASADAPR